MSIYHSHFDISPFIVLISMKAPNRISNIGIIIIIIIKSFL